MTDRSHQISVNLPPATSARLERLRYLSNLWDNALRVPGTKLSVGIESIVGLLPVGGDLIGLLLSCYILFYAIQFELPKTRKMSNIKTNNFGKKIMNLEDVWKVYFVTQPLENPPNPP